MNANESLLLSGQKGALIIATMTTKQDRWKDIVQINPKRIKPIKNFSQCLMCWFIATNVGKGSGIGFQESHICILYFK